jgi:hypothetical protein
MSHWDRIKTSARQPPFLEVNPFPCLFQLLEAARVLLLMIPFLCLQSQQCLVESFLKFFASSTFFSTFKVLCIYIKPSQIKLRHLPILRSTGFNEQQFALVNGSGHCLRFCMISIQKRQNFTENRPNAEPLNHPP